MTLPSLPSLPSLPPSVYVAGVVAFVVAFLLIVTKRWHGRFSMDGLEGVQKMHVVPTPRIGGVAIFAGVLLGWVFSGTKASSILGGILLAGLPAFVAGLIEDLTKRVSVLARLVATIGSGVLAWWVSGVSLSGVDVPLMNQLFASGAFSVAFTAFAVAGVANAVNIIDGFNGLASGFVVIALLGFSAIASIVGDVDLALVCVVIAAAVVGFWLVNWPWGKLFLGDGGSYFVGFALAWISVLLVERNQSVTPFIALLVCIHPVTEVLFSVYRRRMTNTPPGAPDRLHLHTLVMRRVVSPLLRRSYPRDPDIARLMRNPATGLVLAVMTTPAVLMSTVVLYSPVYASLACLGFAIGYVALYARLVRFHWCSPLKFLFVKPSSIVRTAKRRNSSS